MQASDVMVSKVITVAPDANVIEVAKILLAHCISAVPVIASDGKLVGIVSEGDLIRRSESETERQRSWWLELFTSSQTLASEFVKANARKVADIMTRPVIAAAPDTPLREIANLLEKHRIKRVPIVQNGKLVGIVSRANLLQALASARSDAGASADDATLRRRIVDRLYGQSWPKPTQINVIVQAGTVDLWGFVENDLEKKAVRVMAEGTPGVRAVNDHLAYRPTVSAV